MTVQEEEMFKRTMDTVAELIGKDQLLSSLYGWLQQ